MSELPTVYPNGQVRYEIVRSGVQKRDLVEELNLGAFSILMVFKSMSHILCSSHITGLFGSTLPIFQFIFHSASIYMLKEKL